MSQPHPPGIVQNNQTFSKPTLRFDPFGLFFWGFLKSKVYANAPQTIQNLKNNIRAEIVAVDPVLLERVIENFVTRMQACKKNLGGHMNDIIFHL